MARYNKVTGKFEGTSGRNIDSRTKRFWKVASRSRTTGKDIKRKLQEEASEGIKVGDSEGGEFLIEETGEEYKGVWHLDEETGAVTSGTEDDEDGEPLVPISHQATRKIPKRVRAKAFIGTRDKKTKRQAELLARSVVTTADLKRQVRAEAEEGVKVAHTEGGDFLVEDTGMDYQGWYFIDQDGSAQAGTGPDDDGEDLRPISAVAIDKVKRHVDEDDGYNLG